MPLGTSPKASGPSPPRSEPAGASRVQLVVVCAQRHQVASSTFGFVPVEPGLLGPASILGPLSLKGVFQWPLKDNPAGIRVGNRLRGRIWLGVRGFEQESQFCYLLPVKSSASDPLSLGFLVCKMNILVKCLVCRLAHSKCSKMPHGASQPPVPQIQGY